MPELVGLKQIIVDGGDAITPGISIGATCCKVNPALSEPVHTLADDVCFWLYSSGSTGRPKALCICTAMWCKPPSCMAVACWACKKTMWCFLLPSCSLPMAWAMP